MKQSRKSAISARAHQIWEESGHTHGHDERHWKQAEREHDEAEARAAVMEQFNAEPVDATPTEPVRKRAAKTVEPVVEVSAEPVRKPRAPRKTLGNATVN